MIHDCKCIAGIESRQLTIWYEYFAFGEDGKSED